MTRPQYGKPETWPRGPEPVEWHIYTNPPAIRRLGWLPIYEVMVPDRECEAIVWPRVVWGYERAQRVLAAGH